MQIAIKKQQKQEQYAEEEVLQALWTENLNEKRLREKKAILANMKKAQQMKAALLDQASDNSRHRNVATYVLMLHKHSRYECRILSF